MTSLGLLCALLISIVILAFRRFRYIAYTLTDIPTVGPSGFFSTFLGLWTYMFHADKVLEEGHRKYPGTAFKCYTPDGWVVFVSGEARLSDLNRASENTLSYYDFAHERMQTAHTFGPESVVDLYQLNVMKTTMTRNIGARFEDVLDEIKSTVAETLPLSTEWAEHTLFPVVMKVINRTTNRFFLGLPYCRDEAFLQANLDYVTQVIVGAVCLRPLPKILRPLAAKFVVRTNKTYRKIRNILEPMLLSRLRKEETHGKEWDGRPNDYISWLLDVAKGSQRTVRDIIVRILFTNFAALHTSTMSLTNALLDIAAHPEYLQPLREEIEALAKAEEGWSKATIDKMAKLDSFLKESERMWSIVSSVSGRDVVKPFVFSNGQVLPPGVSVVVVANSTQLDKDNYVDAQDFRPFRFSEDTPKETEGESVESTYRKLITPDHKYLAFGTGKHACPGRFFANIMMKATFAHIIMNYDVQLKDGETRPASTVLGFTMSPSQTTKVLFRRRR